MADCLSPFPSRRPTFTCLSKKEACMTLFPREMLVSLAVLSEKSGQACEMLRIKV